MTEIEFFVPGVPVGKARARVVKGRAFTPKKSKDYEKKVAYYAAIAMRRARAETFQGAVEVQILAEFPPLKSWSKKQTELVNNSEVRKETKPDIDNIAKSIADAMNGVVYVDDSQISDLICRKRYSATAGVTVRVRGLK